MKNRLKREQNSFERESLKWDLCCLRPDGTRTEFFEAAVPGNAQLDYARAFGLPDYREADNYLQYEFLEDCGWIYRAKLPGRKGTFCCGGVDYAYAVRLDGREVLRYEGMFKGFRFPVSETNRIVEIEVDPVPRRADAPKGRQQADRVCKPPVSYGWDWHPRLIPSGIWEEAWFAEGDAVTDASVTYRLNETLDRAEVVVSCVCGEPVDFRLRTREGELVFSAQIPPSGEVRFALDSPRLWWCSEQGEPYLYTAEFDSGSTVPVTKKVGFRRVRLLPQPSNWAATFPFTQALPPTTISLNGREVFGKGSNWVNPEIFTGTITRETYAPLVAIAKENHFNLFRCWGGAIVNKESFFELCDEAGIMVWQEFPLACNSYGDDPHYLEVLESESRAILERVRQHACLAVWCGGNELFTGGSLMTEQFHALRLLNANCYRMDPDTPYLNTSPLMGMRHGHYLFRYPDGEECFSGFQRLKGTAFTEFGMPAPSDREYLAGFLPEEELNLPAGTEKGWTAHHAFGAWEKKSWLHREIIEFYFGKCRDLDDLIAKGQLLQYAGYKGLFEEARRQKPDCGMALNWCYNEPWPTAANNSLVNYPARPRKSLAGIGDSLAPVVPSARVTKFVWQEGEIFSAELCLLNDSPEASEHGVVSVRVLLDGVTRSVLDWKVPEGKVNRNVAGPTARLLLPRAKTGIFRLILERNGRIENVYPFLYFSGEDIGRRWEALREGSEPPYVGLTSADIRDFSGRAETDAGERKGRQNG